MKKKIQRIPNKGQQNINSPAMKAASHTPEACAKRSQTAKENRLIQAELYSHLKDALLDGTGAPYYAKFIDKYLKEAYADPSGICGKVVASSIFSENMLSKLDEESEKNMAKELDFLRYRVIKDCFDKQRDVILTPPNKKENIIVCCGRRAGKTDMAAKLIIYIAIIPNSPITYIHKTFTNAIQQCYDNVIKEADKVGLVRKKESRADGIIEFTNGSKVTFLGNNNKVEADKSRGSRNKLIIIDEAAFECNMSYLVNDVLEPTLSDFSDSVLVMLSSPPRVPKTFFEKVWNQKNENGNYTWKHYSWNMFNNPYIPDPKSTLEHICKEKGVTMDSPLIRREYLGEFVYDTEAQVYKGYKTYKKEEKEAILKNMNITNIVIGNDFGFSDYNGVVMLAYDVVTKQGIVLEESKFNQSTVEAIVELDRKYYDEAKKIMLEKNNNTNNILIITDSNEKSITFELNTTYKLPAYTCYKYDKMMAISSLAEAMRTGRITIQSNGAIADECEQTVYKRDEEDHILSEIDDTQFHPDILDSLLYAYRQMMYDCGDTTIGGQSSDLKQANVTLPPTLNITPNDMNKSDGVVWS